MNGEALSEDDVPGPLDDVGDHGLAVPPDVYNLSDDSDASEGFDDSAHGQSGPFVDETLNDNGVPGLADVDGLPYAAFAHPRRAPLAANPLAVNKSTKRLAVSA